MILVWSSPPFNAERQIRLWLYHGAIYALATAMPFSKVNNLLGRKLNIISNRAKEFSFRRGGAHQPMSIRRDARLTAYRFNQETFAYESFDDEIVVLNLVDGIYFAFGGTAVVAWPYIVGQHSLAAITSALATRCGVQADTLGSDLLDFVAHLLSEKILLTAPESTSAIDCSQLGSSFEYRGFSFERHTDMEDLLTLDPIHDVDPEGGWPQV